MGIYVWYMAIDLFILGADLALFLAILAVLYQVQTKKAATGLSLQTLFLVVSARVMHMLSHPLDLHFEPAIMPSIAYTLLDISNALLGMYCLFVVVSNYLHTYEGDKDNFGEGLMRRFIWPDSPKEGLGRLVVRVGFCYVFALILGIVWWTIRRSHQPFLVSYFACVYEVLGAISLLPQLFMFQKDRVASPQLANFVVLIALNRLCTLAFWIIYPWVFLYRYPDNRGIQMASEIINLLIISDFLFYYIRAKLRGESYVKVPTALHDIV